MSITVPITWDFSKTVQPVYAQHRRGIFSTQIWAEFPSMPCRSALSTISTRLRLISRSHSSSCSPSLLVSDGANAHNMHHISASLQPLPEGFSAWCVFAVALQLTSYPPHFRRISTLRSRRWTTQRKTHKCGAGLSEALFFSPTRYLIWGF